ncbi:MAG TPA: GNAT family N-acetyltransferase [Longimicrobium sp.]|nr:GNAT family N-acetyltransferase [Longimicrobium sp.]
MTEPAFLFDGYAAVRLSSADVAELQALHERCTDYFELIQGAPTEPTSAAEDLVGLPPGKELADKHYFGIHAADGALTGALELLRDWPNPGTWWLGLLMLDPPARGAGLGARIYTAAREWVRAQGGETISLAVLEQNTQAERFWRRLGFAEIERTPFVASTGLTSGAIIMRQRIAPAEPA